MTQTHETPISATPSAAQAAAELLSVSKMILARLDFEAAERGEDAVFLGNACRQALRSAIARVETSERIIVAVHVEGGIVAGVSSNNPAALAGVEFLLLDYDTEGADDNELFAVRYLDNESSQAVGGPLELDASCVDLERTMQNAKGE